MTKKITVEIEFEEMPEDDGWVELVPSVIRRVQSDLTDSQIDSLGESIAQTDTWQVDRWIDLQTVLGNSNVKEVKIKR